MRVHSQCFSMVGKMMSSPSGTKRTPAWEEWRKGIEAALIRARQQARDEGRAAGVPIVYMQDGRVVEDNSQDDG